jgi:hypothetical protein
MSPSQQEKTKKKKSVKQKENPSLAHNIFITVASPEKQMRGCRGKTSYELSSGEAGKGRVCWPLLAEPPRKGAKTTTDLVVPPTHSTTSTVYGPFHLLSLNSFVLVAPTKAVVFWDSFLSHS